jgi:hypothetical protein
VELSRRGFLGILAAAPLGRALSAVSPSAPAPGVACALPESRAGFVRALAGRAPSLVTAVPGAAGWDESIELHVRRGRFVIFESGAAFADARAFAEQRAGLRAAFGLTIEDPTRLWSEGHRPSYLDLVWPAPARIRDFSYAIVVRGGEVVGSIGGRPVATIQRSGDGALLFLGSPVGPALWHADAEARAWLASVLDQPPTSPARSRSAVGATAPATPAAHSATTIAVNTSIV